MHTVVAEDYVRCPVCKGTGRCIYCQGTGIRDYTQDGSPIPCLSCAPRAVSPDGKDGACWRCWGRGEVQR